MVREITTLEELQSEFQNDKTKGKLVVLDFHATWCGPCKTIAPKVQEMSVGQYKDTVVFLKCDVDQAEALSQEYNIEAMPTFVFFKDGKEIHRMVGGNPNQLAADVEKYSQ